ncbi:sensor histidine kinase [Nocardioides sp. AX2bis]|uniref:sensor histidine kinase n=1 Tax=Nocardioides sp. AX2bis TaxID=2653157 RepID=UPI0012F40FED|nr:sensor histidine kinase [Nocardioides sp. AX2bis]VXB22189.1 Two-component system sensor histidine kinase DesK [Nocardioides sp. AX2bis]
MSRPAPVSDPGQRYGWLLWSVWLVFLVFPLVAALGADRPGWVRGLAVLAVLGFAATYVVATLRLSRRGAGPRESVVVLAVLAGLGLAMVPAVGLQAISVVPFLQSFTMFALPRPWCWVAAGVAVVSTVALPLAAGEDQALYFTLIVLGTAAGTGAGRLMSDHAQEYARVSDQLTVTAERERLARDVHDLLGHSLTVVTVKAELAERLVRLDPERAESELREIRALTREALADVRATVGGLRAARLDDELAGAAAALADAGLATSLPADAGVLDPRHRPVAGWVLREAVTNVIRHSGATSCRVELGPHLLRVVDDGAGLPAGGSGTGHGLRGLRERVEQSGGSLRLGAGDDGRGAAVQVTW